MLKHEIFFLLFLFFCTCNATDYYRTLLFGDLFKGFLKINPVGEDQYVVSFEVSEMEGELVWSLHTSSAPYDMADMTDNCRRVKKSPHLLREMSLKNATTVAGTMLSGNTIVVGNRDEVMACATVILPTEPLMATTFHVEPIEGHIHLIPMKDQLRLLTDLRYMPSLDDYEPGKFVLEWALVPSCQPNETERLSDGSELGVDSRSTIIYYSSNYSLQYFAIYKQGELFSCGPILPVEPRLVMGVDAGFTQQNYYEAVHASTDVAPNKLRIRDDCLDISTESEHEKYDMFYPTVNIFGPDSIMLKSMSDGLCSVLRPQFPRPAATAYFVHPIMGRITIVDTDDKILLTGELRNKLEASSTRASIQISSEPAATDGCLENLQCTGCPQVQDAALVVGRDDETVSLSGGFTWFNLSAARSVIVDLESMKICANLTFLPNGAISAHALFQKITPAASTTVASIVTLEYPANNYTEVLINKHQLFEEAVAHYRPLDPSITNGHPCSEQDLGPVKPVFWAPRLSSILSSDMNDSSYSAYIWLNMVTGKQHSVLGTSAVLKQGKDVFCGHFEPRTAKTVAVAKLQKPFSGFVRLTYHSDSNWASSFPTQVYYYVKNATHGNTLRNNKEHYLWDIVECDTSDCRNATVFNPFNAEAEYCLPSKSYLCPLGNLTVNVGPLYANVRRHMTVKDLPLVGPFSVIGKYMRVTSSGSHPTTTFAEIRRFSQAIFRWIVPVKTSHSAAQSGFAEKADLEHFQVGVDYTRVKYHKKCNIMRITVSAEDEQLDKILNQFDAEGRKFKTDPIISCGDEEVSTTPSHSSAISVAPSLYSLLAIAMSSLLFTLY